MDPQVSDLVDSSGRFSVEKHSAIQDQILEKNIADKIKKAVVDNDVLTLENRVHDTILTAMDNLVIPRVEMAVRSITELRGRGPNSMGRNPDQRNFSGKILAEKI